MSALKDVAGMKFNKLTVIKRVGTNPTGNALWLCECDCGNETTVSGQHLRSGNTKSCGCLAKFKHGEGSFRKLYKSYVKNASRRSHEWNLSEDRFRELTKMECHYCGREPEMIAKAQGGNGEYIYNGVDRVDNSLGYTIDNSITACKYCNQAKHAMSYDNFIELAHKISKNFK